jgi:phosphoserine phosphatase
MSAKIVFFDCDGTLTTVKSSWQYLHERLDLWDGQADEFQRLFRAGEIDYREFCRRDAALWKGLPEGRVLDIVGEIPYHDGVRETMETLKTQDIRTVVLSTGLSFLVERVRRELRIDAAVANDLIVEDGMLTGEIRLRVAHDEAAGADSQAEGLTGIFQVQDKGYWVRSMLRRYGLKKADAAAVGDSEGDRSMFGEVGIAVGYHPSAGVLPFLHHALHNGSFKEVFEVLRARA